MVERKTLPSIHAVLVAVLISLGSAAGVGCGSHPVNGSTLSGAIKVTADSPAITAGTATQLHATMTNSSNQVSDITPLVSWSSFDPSVAVVNPLGRMTGMAAGNTTITATFSNSTGVYAAAIGAPAVTGLALYPRSAAVFTNGKQAYTALATYANNTAGNVTDTAEFSVTPASVATIDASGMLTAVASGSYTVTTVVGTKTLSATGTVVDAPLTSIAVTPATANIAGAATQQFTAVGTYADQTTKDLTRSVTWGSSNPGLLAVDANGLATADGDTTTHAVTVTAQTGMLAGRATVQVGIGKLLTGLVVTPTSSSIANGTAEPHAATATYSDGSQRDVTGSVTWSVVAGTASSVGHAAGLHLQGRALHAQAALDSPTQVVAVDQTGVDSAMAPGITTVQASMGALQSQSVVIVTSATVKSLAITSSKTLFPAQSMQPMHLIGHFSDGTTQDLSLTANWQSSDSSVITIDGKGNAMGVQAGKAQVSASFGGLSASTGDLTVLPTNLLYATIKAFGTTSPVGVGEQLQMLGTYSDGTVQDLTSLATWATANPNVQSVESYGFVHPVGPGVTEVTGTALGRTATISLAVIDTKSTDINPQAATPTFALGTTDAFSALTDFSNGIQTDTSPVALWTSSDPTVLTINSSGRAKAGRTGTATVTASVLGVTQTSAAVQVTGANLIRLLVSPNTAQIAALTQQQYKAIGFFDDNTVQDISGDVSWSTEDITLATIDKDGLLFGAKAGSTHVVCTFGSQTVRYPVTVTAATLQSVAVSPANTELPLGVRTQFSLLGTFSDGTVQDLSTAAVWSSSTPSIVTVLGQGIVFGSNSAAVGSVSAQYGFLSASTSVNVTDASLTSLALAPQDTTVRVGAYQPLTLTGTFSDGFTQALTLDDAFVSSSPKVAQVLATDDTAYAVGVGTTKITAIYRGQSATTASFNVLSNVISSISLSPQNPTLTAGGTLQFLATATYADGSTAFVSRTAIWTSSNPDVLDVDSSGFATAMTTAVPVAVTVTATAGGATGSFVVNVMPATSASATLVSVAVTPANASFALGTSQQFVLTATYSDGSTQDVTPSAVWTSSSPSVATISSTGRATSIKVGSVQFTGTFQGHTASTTSVQITQGATLASLVVIPTSSSIAAGSAEKHTVLAFYSDGSQVDVTDHVSWSASSPTVAPNAGRSLLRAQALQANAATGGQIAVDQTGVDRAVTPGTAMVQASLGGLASQSTVIVTAATVQSLAIRATRDLFPAGATQPVMLIGTFSDGTKQDLSLTGNWVSSDASVATIDSSGLATGIKPGNVTFTASFGGLTASTVGYRVLPANLISLTINVDRPVIAVSTSESFQVIGTYADGTTHDVTSLASWNSTNASILPIDQRGFAYGKTAGVAQIVATVGNLSAIATVFSFDVRAQSIDILPVNSSFALGTTQPLLALGHYSNGSILDITSFAIWKSEDPTILTIDGNGRAKGGRVGTTRVTATRLDLTQESTDIQVTDATLVSLRMIPNSGQVAVFTGLHYRAYGIFSDGRLQDVTQDVIWNTTDNTVASIDTTGFGIGMKPGNVQVTATMAGQTVSTPLTVTGATLTSVAVTPGGDKVPKNVTRQYKLVGNFNDGSQQDLTQDAIWIAPTPTIADVIFKGEVLGLGLGVGEVTAQYGYFSGSTPVSITPATLVSTAMTPASANVKQGVLQQFVHTGTFSDGQQVDLAIGTTFTTATPDVAQMLPSGLAYARAPGTAQMQAGFHGGGTSTPFNVSSATLVSLAVTPANPSVLIGATQQFAALGTYADGTTADVTGATIWTSSNPLIFSIDQNGFGTALSLVGLAGRSGRLSPLPLANSASPTTVPMTASSGGQTKAFNVTVLPATVTLTSVAVSPTSASFAKGTTQQFMLTGTYSDGSTQDLSGQATWATSASSVGTISSTGVASGAGVGSVQFTGSYSGKTSTTGTVSVTPPALVSLAVTPSNPSFAKGTTQQFTVTGTYTDGTTQDLTSSSTYASTNAGVVSVNSGGLATGVNMGSAQVTISSGGQTVTTGAVQVTAATLTSITVNPTSTHAAAGTMVQLTVLGGYTDGSTADVTSSATWATSDTSLASVTSTGLVTGVSTGLATIQAQVGARTATSTIRVSTATLTSVAISPSGASVAAGLTEQFMLTGTFSDGSTQDLSSSANWTTSDGTVAGISATGLATGVAPGSVLFTASYGGQTATTPTVMVTPATLVSIAVTPSSPSFARGTDQQFHITGTYSDGSMHDLTGSATFTSSDPKVVSISGSGLGQGLGTGSAQIMVSAGGQTASTQSVTVTPATLTSIAITPNSPSLADGTTQHFVATGTFSDGTTQDLSAQAVWRSSNAQVMTIDQTGLASTFQVGGAQVSATIDGMTVTSGVISVTPATLAGLSVTPASVQIAKGTVRQMTATGTYTDGTTQNLSSMAIWTTSDGTVVTVSASGLATGTGTGSAMLTASLQGKTGSTSTFQVTAATLVSIAFNPAHPTVAAGSNSQVSVIGTYSDGSTQDLTGTAIYNSSNTTVATVNSSGVIAGVAPGTSTITVQANGATNSFQVTVSNATLVSIALTPTNPMAFAKGTTEQFTATGTYSDGTTQDLSTSTTWTSSNPSVFTVDGNGLATGTGVGSGQLTAAYQGQTATTPAFQVSAATISSLAITPGNVSVAAGNTQQYTATATYTDGTTQDVSGTATWSSSNQSVATVNSSGFATAVSSGRATIRAQYQGLAGAASLTVTSAAATLQQIVVTPAGASSHAIHANARSASPNATVGGTQQFSATAVYSDRTTRDVTTQSAWTSSNPSIAAVNSVGLASLLASGSTSIQALFGGLSGASSLAVTSQAATLQSIAVNPSSASIAANQTQQFSATGTYSDGSTQNLTSLVTWQTSNPSIASINNSGLATGAGGGQSQVTASYLGQTAQVTLTVSVATLTSIAVTPNNLGLANGTRQQYMAVGTLSDGSTQDLTNSVNWSSTDASVAGVNATGLVSGLSVGQTYIQATAGNVSTTVPLRITAATVTGVQLLPTSVSLPAGGVQQMMVTATFTDGTSQNVTSSVSYTTSNVGVATVDANGSLHGIAMGTASVTATLGAASATVTATITHVALSSLAITPQNISLADGLSQQLTVTGTFADGSTQDLTNNVTWTSSNAHVAAVSSTGMVTVTGIGMVTITAATGNVSATDSVTATAAAVSAISVSPASTTLAAGQTQQFAATATLTDGSQQTITSSANWSVSDPSKGTISNSGSTKGFLTSSAAGTLNVVATVNGTSGMAAVTVQPAALSALRITPNPVSTPAGTTQQLTVTGSYTDGSTANVTASTAWTSGSATVATVDATGLLHALTAGSTSVQAMVQTTTATATVTVGAVTLSSIAITPSAPSVAKGLQQQMTATGTYTDGSTANITSQVQWSSSVPSVATVSGTGLVSALGTGHSTLTATLNSVSQTAPLTVTPAVLESIAVTSGQSSFALGLSLQLTATGSYSDGTTQDLTGSATWSSTVPSVGMVSSSGLATGVTTGSFTARASFGGVTGSLPVTVTAAVLQTITITPANTIIVRALSSSVQFTATGHFSDGTTQNLTNSVHWALPSGVNVGSISQSGQLSTVNVGIGTVSATLGTIVGTTNFTAVAI